MAELSEDDIRFVLSVDPDEAALKKALDQVNAEIEGARISKIRLAVEERVLGALPPELRAKHYSERERQRKLEQESLPQDVLPVSYWEKRFSKAGEALVKEFQRAGETLKEIRISMDPRVLRERIEVEKEVIAWRRKLEEAEHKERVRQAGGPMSFAWEQLKQGMGGGKGGIATLLGGILGGQGGGMLGQIGGMVGTALGGPVGAVIGESVGKAVEKIPKILATPLAALVSGFRTLADMLREIHGPLGPLGAGLALFSEGLGFVSKALGSIPILGSFLGPVFEVFAAMPKILKDVLESGISFAAKANPGIVRQLSIATEDFIATVGQSFVPVVELMIGDVRELSSIIAQFLPSSAQMRDAWRYLSNQLKSFIREIGPNLGPMLINLFKSVANEIREFASAVVILGKMLTGLASAFNMLFDVLRMSLPLLGFATGGFVGLAAGAALMRSSGKKPIGAGVTRPQGESEYEAISAARPAQITGFEEYQRQLQLQTFGSGTMNTMPQDVNNLAKRVDDIADWFGKIPIDRVLSTLDRVGGTKELARNAVDAAENIGLSPFAGILLRIAARLGLE